MKTIELLLNKIGRKALYWFDFEWANRKYLELLYKMKTDKNLDLNNPVTFNEKIQWLKIYDRNPLYTKMVDKYEAKKYVASKIGEKYVIPLLGVWDRFEDIDFDNLPLQFVLKTTHDSGGIFIVKDKNKTDFRPIREEINKHLKRNFSMAAENGHIKMLSLGLLQKSIWNSLVIVYQKIIKSTV